MNRSSEEEPLPAVAWYYADAAGRSVAYLVDAIVLTALTFLAAVIISVVFGPVVRFDVTAEPHVTVDTALAFVNAGLATLISAVYFIGTWRRFGGTPGQRMLRMRIWTASDAGAVPVGRGAVRWLFVGLPLTLEAFVSVASTGRSDTLFLLALLVWYAVLIVSTARHPLKQGLHDRVAGTVVTKVARTAPWVSSPVAGQDAGVR